jgi:hypothetical protein
MEIFTQKKSQQKHSCLIYGFFTLFTTYKHTLSASEPAQRKLTTTTENNNALYYSVNLLWTQVTELVLVEYIEQVF